MVGAQEMHAASGTFASGGHMRQIVELLLAKIKRIVSARADCLLKAYEKTGKPIDDGVFAEISNDVIQVSSNEQHRAIAAMAEKVQQAFRQPEPSLRDALSKQIQSGVSAICESVLRDLRIRRDELLLDNQRIRHAYAAAVGKTWDVFISHATEDKEAFVRPLASSLQKSGLQVWFDEATLTIGDSLRQKIDEGLAQSRFGIVVLSKYFFAKQWPQQELDGLVSREVAGIKVILPVWHEIGREEVTERSPLLAGRLAARSSDGVDTVVQQLRKAMGL